MGKRKTVASDSDEEVRDQYSSEEVSASESETKSKGKPTRKTTIKKPSMVSDSSDSTEKKVTVSKKVKRRHSTGKNPAKGASEGSGSPIKVLTTKEGDKYVDLGKKKRATVRVFKGAQLLDIREFYDAAGDEKPGKKGISLSVEQWNVLKQATNEIDQLFSTVK